MLSAHRSDRRRWYRATARMPAWLIVTLCLVLLAGYVARGEQGLPRDRSTGRDAALASPGTATAAAVPRAGSPAAATPTADPAPTATPFPMPEPSALTESIDHLLAAESGVFGVLVVTPKGEVRYSRNADMPFLTASLYKLVLLADIFARRERGDLSFEQAVVLREEYFFDWDEVEFFDRPAAGSAITIEEAVWAVGVHSSNIAARSLLGLTDPVSLNRMAHRLGMRNTHLLVNLWDLAAWPPAPRPDVPPGDLERAVAFVEAAAAEGPVNITTPRDMATYFRRLVKGKVVSPEVSEAILEILFQQAIMDRIPALLPAGTWSAHKPGNLPGASHDVGVIYAPDGPVILAALTEDAWDEQRMVQVIQRLALAAYGVLDLPPISVEPEGELLADAEWPEATGDGDGIPDDPALTAEE